MGEEPGLILTESDVRNCEFAKWYAEFGGESVESSKRMITIASQVIPVPKSFVQYLKSDGIILPKAPEALPLKPRDPRVSKHADEDTYDTIGDVDWEQASDSTSEAGHEEYCFEDVEKALHDTLSQMQEAFVKLKWTAPMDAEWVAGTVKCHTPGDVYLLLKSSDFIQHDLLHAFDDCFDCSGSMLEEQSGVQDSEQPRRDGEEQVYIVLRRWSNLNKAMEFRCFVYDNELIAIVQRYPQEFHSFLNHPTEVQRIRGVISDFFFKHCLADRFPSDHFVFDAYVDKNSRVWLVDFGPLPRMVPLNELEDPRAKSASERLAQVPPHALLSWIELYHLAKECRRIEDDAENVFEEAGDATLFQPKFIVVQSEKEALSMGDVTRSHRVPIELVTGELTQDIVDQAKAQLDQMKVE